MKRITLIVVTSLTALAAAAAGIYLGLAASNTPGSAQMQTAPASRTVAAGELIGSHRPDFSLPDVAGQMRHISEWDGKVLALNFWATWCPPCLKEIPEFIELQHRYEDRGLQFIGIALQHPEELGEFMQEKGMNYPVLAGELEVINIAESYGNDIGALPYTVIINRDGKIHFVKRGPLAGADAEAMITELL